MTRSDIKKVLVVLVTVGFIMISLPGLRTWLLLYQQSKITVIEEETISAEKVEYEQIETPTFANLLAMEAFDLEAIGFLEIESVAISVPVFAGITNEYLTFGAASMFPTREIEKENIVLLGHHLGYQELLLGRLLDVKVGDDIYLRYLGENVHYQVIETKVISDREVEVTETYGESQLTLLTCEKPYLTNQRFMVKAEPVKSENNEPQAYQHKKIEAGYLGMRIPKRLKIETGLLILLYLGVVWLILKEPFKRNKQLK